MVHTCVVWGCTNRADPRSTKRQYFDIPKVIHHQGENTERLSLERRNLWLARINREGFDADPNKRHYKVCSDHFIAGKKADLYDNTNPDWAPSQKMGPELQGSCPTPDPQSTKKRYQRAKSRQEKVKKFKAAEALLDLQKDTSLCVVPNTDTTRGTDKAEIENYHICEKPADDTPTDGQLVEMMRSELQRLTSENMELKDKLKETVLSPETLDDEKAKHYTGLDHDTLMTVYHFLEPSIPGRVNSSLTKFEKMLVVMMKLRLNLSLQDLAFRFKVSKSCVSKVFLDTIHVMYIRLKPIILWPERAELQLSMPMEFRKYFGVKVSIIIDCFEVFIERPSNLLARSETWSNYKHHNTAKFLIGITPQGAVSFLSKGYGGRVSDKYVTEHCGLLDKLLPGDIVLADRGFDIKESVGLNCAEVKIPAFTRGKSQLSPVELETMRKIAHTRIHVERVIGLVRNKFTILQSTIPIDYLHSNIDSIPTIDKITTVCCALTNFCDSVVPFD
ncbi:uncharacterized protein LOC132560527 [Ylistrum balloti]|uniref:uncharacterized protein LOC132560527 n=1 Tax=Ylistrum balloti TaxID=509963 RepID=UPI002905EE66|nr:uncharacterized protein LOC132560527 [Ylistrum balloti]